jgi:hypothetical protein
MYSIIFSVVGLGALCGVSVIIALKNARVGVETTEGLVLIESSNAKAMGCNSAPIGRNSLAVALRPSVGLKSLTFD